MSQEDPYTMTSKEFFEKYAFMTMVGRIASPFPPEQTDSLVRRLGIDPTQLKPGDQFGIRMQRPQNLSVPFPPTPQVLGRDCFLCSQCNDMWDMEQMHHNFIPGPNEPRKYICKQCYAKEDGSTIGNEDKHPVVVVIQK